VQEAAAVSALSHGARLSCALLSLATASCSGCAVDSTAPAPKPGPARDGAVWSYDVEPGDDAHELRIEALYSAASKRPLSVARGAEPFIHDVEIQDGDAWKKLEPVDDYWTLPDDKRSHRLRYRFLLHDAAHARRDPDLASFTHDVYVSPPSAWLLHPFDSIEGDVYRLHITSVAGDRCVCGVTPDPSGAACTFSGAAEDLSTAPYCAFGPLHVHRVRAPGGAEVVLGLAPGDYAVSEDAIVKWVEQSALAVGGYFGVFPVRHSVVIVAEGRGIHVEGGKTVGNSGASIIIGVGRRARQHALDDDWILTHEMIHLALPSVAREHHWLEEGSATYLEPVARARAGTHTEEQLWRELVDGMPQGEPESGDRGLDHTPTWGRTYWGGALYWMLADIEIRKRTHNERGLEHALRGVIDAGGTIAETWEVKRVLDTADKAAGVTVLAELYAKMADDPAPVDLAALWKELGVAVSGKAIAFDDSAPLASVRRAISRRAQ
jgi:hypothetical protein